MRRRRRLALVGLFALLVGAALVYLLPRLPAAPRVLAPGVTYQRHARPGPVRAHVLTLDRAVSRARLLLRTAGERLDDLAPLAEIAALPSPSGELLAAVNAGQFDRDGTPIGLLVRDGAMLRGALGRPVFTLNEEGAPFISQFGYKLSYATRQFPLGLPVDRYNRAGAGQVCVYSDAYPFEIPAPTGSLVLRVEAVLPHGIRTTRPTYGKLEQVQYIHSATSLTAIPGRLLVRFVGPEVETLRQLHYPNQLVQLNPEIEGPVWSGEIAHAVGGSDILLAEGRLPAELREEERLGLDTARDARSAVGYSRDHQRIFLVVVEGRHAGSVGMTLSELARFMAELKVWAAMNLDGGGSAGLWLAGQGVVSAPDAARPLNNALMVVRE